LVVYERGSGDRVYYPADSADDAVRVVEGLRNDLNVADARIYELRELPFQYRPYFRVELTVSADVWADAYLDESEESDDYSEYETSDESEYESTDYESDAEGEYDYDADLADEADIDAVVPIDLRLVEDAEPSIEETTVLDPADVRARRGLFAR
jgi:hypothetical protein